MLKKINGVTGEVTIVPTPSMSQPKSNEELIEEFWNDLEIDGVTYKGARHWKELHKKRLVDKRLRTVLAQKDAEVAEARREVYDAIMSLPAWYIDDADGHFRDKVLSLVTPKEVREFATAYCEVCKRVTATDIHTGACGGCFLKTVLDDPKE